MNACALVLAVGVSSHSSNLLHFTNNPLSIVTEKLNLTNNRAADHEHIRLAHFVGRKLKLGIEKSL